MKTKLIAAILATTAILGVTQVAHAFDDDAPRCEDGVLEVDGSNGEFTFSGYCEKVIIGGGDNRVVLGDVGTLEIMGNNHDIRAGNVKVLDLGGGDHAVKLGNIGSADIVGNDHDVLAGVIGTMDVAGGNNAVKSERLGSVTVIGNDHLIEYRRLNPGAKDPKKLTHPARSVKGSSNLVRWNKVAGL